MAETKITYAADVALAVTAWDTTLLTGEAATSAIFDNSSSNFMDVLLGGIIEGDTITGILAAGESFDLYIAGQYSDTATDMGGAIDALFGAAGEEVEDVSWVKANMTLLKSIQVEPTAPDVDQGYHFGPISVAQFFGGVMPKRFILLLHNNTGASLGAGSDVNTQGITYTTT